MLHVPPTHVAFCVSAGQPGGITVYEHEAEPLHVVPATGSIAGHVGGVQGGLSSAIDQLPLAHVATKTPGQSPGTS
jgi:hypothetical protein